MASSVAGTALRTMPRSLVALGFSTVLVVVSLMASFWAGGLIAQTTGLGRVNVHLIGGILLVAGFICLHQSLKACIRKLVRQLASDPIDLFNYGQEKKD